MSSDTTRPRLVRTHRAPVVGRALVTSCTLLLGGLAGPTAASAQMRFAVEGFLGGAVNTPSSLTLRQDGEPDIRLTARYDTRSLQVPVYWSVRFSLLDERRALELQLTHHKLHLSNPPPEVQQFEITHGFNLLTVAYAVRSLPVDLRGGIGVVLAHPEGTIRGRRFGGPAGALSGHTLAGPVLTVGAGKRFEASRGFLLTAASAVTATWANGLKANAGSVDATNYAFHLRLGVGYLF